MRLPHLNSRPGWVVAVGAILLTGCAHTPADSKSSFKRRDVASALDRTTGYFRDHVTGRINPDDFWLFHLAARHRPELRATPLQTIDPHERFSGHAMLRLIDSAWKPDDLVIQPASETFPAAVPGGAYHIAPPHDRDLYLPRDEVLLKAVYCPEFGFDTDDVAHALSTRDHQGGYDDTHALASLLIVKHSGCLPAEALAPAIAELVDALIQAQEKTDTFNDLFVERVAFLYWAGAGKRVQPAWIATILDRQRDNGGWGADGSSGTNLHQTTLATLALIYYFEGKDRAAFWGLPPL